MSNGMNRFICCLTALTASAAVSPLFAAEANAVTAASAAPVAHVYVATPKGVYLYNAWSAGNLTLSSTTPYAGNFIDMVTNGKWLYGTDGTSIYEDAVAANGTLKRVGSYNPATNDSGSGPVESLNLDHTGSFVYCVTYSGNDGDFYQSYKINQTNGGLTYLGTAGGHADYRFGFGPVRILGNNKFAFQTQAYMTDFLAGFGIENGGALGPQISESASPTAKPSDGYNPYALTIDPTNHLIAAVFPMYEPPSGNVDGPTQLAIYTSDTSGVLSTTSTYANMPVVAVSWVSDMSMSPSGKLLAVAGNGQSPTAGQVGQGGLQVFHYNGGSSITKYTGLLTTAHIDQVHWDNANHLYAISKAAGKVYVFTVTPTSVVQSPGSPYSVASPQRLIVRPL